MTNSKSTSNLNYKKLKSYGVLIASIGIFGILICLYSLQVEIIKSKDKSYVAFCDINQYISCSKVFTSKYGKGFGLMPKNTILDQPNSVYGLIFYVIMLILLLLKKNELAFRLRILLSIMANIGTVYLASILFFVLGDFCIVCVTMYIINGLLMVFNLKHYKYFSILKEINSKKKST